MGYEYAKRKSALPVNGDTRASREAQAPHVSMDSLRTALGVDGAGGQRVDLESAMRSKMERMFGMDLQNLKLYVSQQVDDAGAEAAASGNIIAFAPGKLNLFTHSGQALLGHELSHVAAQARGEARGSGFLDSPAMEARADREGAMAAAGQPVYGGGPAASLPASASGPIQAKKKKAAPPAQQTQPAPAASNGNGTQSGSGMKPL
ncbi:MAG: DUF4157 domain-containing protein, partial [Oscillibacter sp.]|nr:DUF4157 domain-containing protein [Oscillibacter sp.]